MATSTLSTLASTVGAVFARLATIVGSDEAFRGVMLQLGWRCETVPPAIAALSAPVNDLVLALGDGQLSFEDVGTVLGAIQDLARTIDDLGSSGVSFPDDLTADGFDEAIARQLVDYLIVEFLEDEYPLAISLLAAAGLSRVIEVEASGNRPASIQQTIEWQKIPAVLSDPRQVLADAYGWGTDQLDHGLLTEMVVDLGESLGVSISLAALDPAARATLEAGSTEWNGLDTTALVLTIYEGADGEAGIQLYGLPSSGSRKPGVAILPYVTGTVPNPIQVTENVTFAYSTELNLGNGVAVVVRPGESIELLSGLTGAPGTGNDVQATLTYAGSTSERVLLLGSSDGTRLQATAVSVTAGATTASIRDLSIEFQLVGGQLIIDGGEGNSFLGALLGDAVRTIDLSPAIGWSTERGAFIPGGAGLGLALPLNLAIGPITIEDVLIDLMPDGDRIDVDLGASLTALIGPFEVLADKIGVTGEFRFPGSGGNLGPLDADVRFLPPTLLLFGLETEAISGGGLIQIDPETGRYSGGLALDIFGLGISAIIIIDTEVPGTSWVLFASIGVVFPTPIPIGFGFTVIGVGGLIAVNRTMDVNALASGLKTGAADAILFPDNFLDDATTILSGVDQWFPIQSGTTTFGPVAAIGWGNPTLITAQLGVAIALPDLIVALLGSVEVLLPTEDEAVLAFRMDILGAVDIPASEVLVAASLHDSTLLEVFELSGDMGFYARVSGQPLFLLSIGGYHPQFDPPGALPSWILDLRRTSASIALAEDVHVTLTSYVALTSNTVQFGGQFKLLASVKVLLTTYTATGWFGINLLLVLKPLKFSARATAGVSISAGDRELFGVQLIARLEGPKPWFANGSAYFNFFGLDVNFGFEIGAHPGGAPRELHDVVEDVVLALEAGGVWTPVNSTPTWSAGVVMTATLPAGLWARPDQLIEIRQNVAPLNRTITAFGEFIPESDRVVADQVMLGSTPIASPDWIDDWFAPAQFDRLDEGDSLSAPSYELMIAGVRFGDDEVAVSANPEFDCTSVSRQPEESIFPDRRRRKSPFVSAGTNLRGKSSSRTVKGPRLAMQPTSYTIVRAADGKRAGSVLGEAGGATRLTYAEAVHIVDLRVKKDAMERARLRVVPFTAAVA